MLLQELLNEISKLTNQDRSPMKPINPGALLEIYEEDTSSKGFGVLATDLAVTANTAPPALHTVHTAPQRFFPDHCNRSFHSYGYSNTLAMPEQRYLLQTLTCDNDVVRTALKGNSTQIRTNLERLIEGKTPAQIANLLNYRNGFNETILIRAVISNFPETIDEVLNLYMKNLSADDMRMHLNSTDDYQRGLMYWVLLNGTAHGAFAIIRAYQAYLRPEEIQIQLYGKNGGECVNKLFMTGRCSSGAEPYFSRLLREYPISAEQSSGVRAVGCNDNENNDDSTIEIDLPSVRRTLPANRGRRGPGW